MNYQIRFILSIAFILCISILNAQNATVSYSPSSQDIPNPERGFYYYSDIYASNPTPLDLNDLISRRSYYTPWSANYQVHSTLVFRYFILDSFTSTAISQSFLDEIENDFNTARAAGVKLIIRFSYTNTAPTGNCGSWICPPYGDASKAIVLQHIAQLGPLFQAHNDIIATMQMGFIGVWGEQYYTDHFGDASLTPFILTNMNWTDRNDVLAALLNEMPSDRTIQARYPQQKQRFVYGLNAPTTSAPLSLSEAYDGSDKSRIGFHNDCFLASADDFGTYADYGPPVSLSDTTNLKAYLATDSQYVPVGGETCGAYAPYDDCATAGGYADTELERFNFSYLNAWYNNSAVNNDWTSVCMDDIKLRMGYRFQLIDGSYPTSASAGSTITVNINLENTGYTAPFNPRGAELVLRSTLSGDTYFVKLEVDPRFWDTGTHSINASICLPPNLPAANYELLLNLPDPMPSIYPDPNYAIQLSNMNIWEATTGYNNLNHIIQVSNTQASTVCYAEPMVSSISSYDPAYCQMSLNLNGPQNSDIYRADDMIYSNGSVPSTEYTIFQAGNLIELDAGFEVLPGASFWAIIQDCQ